MAALRLQSDGALLSPNPHRLASKSSDPWGDREPSSPRVPLISRDVVKDCPQALSSTKVIVATTNINQWAMDFDGNLDRTVRSINEAKSRGATLRVGPELELCGYSCEDHFLELDTYLHSEQSLAAILASDVTMGILCDIGLPVIHENVRYNCKVFCLDRKILLIRPKSYLANDGNYHEPRFFTSWKNSGALHSHGLSKILSDATGQSEVPFGMAILEAVDTKIGCEICEELWAPNSPHIDMALQGAEIFVNGSGSHHSLRKLDARLTLMKNATAKCGGVYIYSNHRGCDGTRLYFDGSSLVAVNGHLVAQASQFSLRDIEVVSCVIDLEEVRCYRQASGSMQEQSSQSARRFPVVKVPARLCLPLVPSMDRHVPQFHHPFNPAEPTPPRIHCPEEECLRGPACWLWDYLRRSAATGFLLPLSGGADSSSVCAIVFTMCLMAVEAVAENDLSVTAQVKLLFPGFEATSEVSSALQVVFPATEERARKELLHAQAQRLCHQLLHTTYLGTKNSSTLTRDRASNLAKATGAYHSTLYLDIIVDAVLAVFTTLTGKQPRFKIRGGTISEDLALQNIQARLRMVMSYLLAQLLPWVRWEKGWLLVLASANVDESLRGYMTKYDCSSADINPIGGMCKADLKRMMEYASESYCDMGILKEIALAAPTAELQPLADGEGDGASGATTYSQLDEEDMGMSYAELTVFGRLRKIGRCGPVGMFRSLLANGQLAVANGLKYMSPKLLAEKVKRFFYFYAVNRHKMTTITPSYHAEGYSPDDNRFDFRQFLYNAKWTRQNRVIDSLVEEAEQCEKADGTSQRL